MAKCIKCGDFFPPNYTEIVPNHMPDKDGNDVQQCIFCKLQVDEVERETNVDSGQYIKYTKEQCVKDYKNFLDKLKNNKNVFDAIDFVDNISNSNKKM